MNNSPKTGENREYMYFPTTRFRSVYETFENQAKAHFIGETLTLVTKLPIRIFWLPFKYNSFHFLQE